jgi:hypothetical protein
MVYNFQYFWIGWIIEFNAASDITIRAILLEFIYFLERHASAHLVNTIIMNIFFAK